MPVCLGGVLLSKRREYNALHLHRFAGFRIRLNVHPAQSYIVRRHFVLVRRLKGNPLERLLLLHAENGIIRTRHSHIRLERGSSRKNTPIGSWRVRMCPDHRRHSSIKVPAHCHFLCCRVGVKIHKYHFGLLEHLRDGPVSCLERIIDRLHVDPALDIQNADLPLFSHIHHDKSIAAVFPGIVQRTKDTSVSAKDFPAVPPIPHMIACCNHVGAKLKNLLRMILGNPLAFRDVLAVDDEEIHIVFLDIVRNERYCKLKSGLADNIANEEDVQGFGHGEFRCGCEKTGCDSIKYRDFNLQKVGENPVAFSTPEPYIQSTFSWHWMNRLLFILCFLLAVTDLTAQQPVVKSGVEVLRDRGFDVLKGKRVGLITNPTGVDSKLISTTDVLFNAKDVKLVALFGPEHGVRGNLPAGEKAESSIDERTKLPVYSLYGKTRKPTKSMLRDIDVLVYDIQDIGCRSYTFISTMGLAMEAAAESKIEFVVLDRPNPLGGLKVEGNIIEKGFESFVAQYPIPYVYGLTCGELARLLNDEGMLANGAKCKLTVIPMQGWKRTMTFDDTGLPWVPTSPHIPTSTSPRYYVATGILGELGVVSEGVGYTLPFQMFAAEWIDPERLAMRMTAQDIEGVMFRPVRFRPFYGRNKDKDVGGVQIYITDYSKVNLMSLQFRLLQVHHDMYPDKNPFEMADARSLKSFDAVLGTDEIRKRFTKSMRFEDVRDYLNKDVETFRKKSKKYLLY